MISQNDFKVWQSDPVTVAVMNTIKQRIIDGMNELSFRAGQDITYDNFMRGFLQGQREVLDITFEGETDD